MSGWHEVAFDRETLARFKVAYQNAAATQADDGVFTFDGHEYIVGYARYVIEALEKRYQDAGNNFQIVAPLVNMNGTSYQELMDNHQAVLRDVDDLLTRMADIAPHGRDYPSGSVGVRLARAQWERWRGALVAIRDGVESVAERIATQGRRR